MQRLRRTAPQGVRQHRYRVQGYRVLQDRQPVAHVGCGVIQDGGAKSDGGKSDSSKPDSASGSSGGDSSSAGLGFLGLGFLGLGFLGLGFLGLGFLGLGFLGLGFLGLWRLGVRVHLHRRFQRGSFLITAATFVDSAEIAVIGGSGFYRFLDDATSVTVETPFGDPSSPLTIGHLGGRSVAFLARHGLSHGVPPHRINVRANMWALREVGVSRVIGPCASGSLRHDIAPGDLVLLDQLLDRTWGRDDTYLHGPAVDHVSFADPYCPELRSAIAAAAGRPGGWPGGQVHPAGSVVVVQGPRFSTRAESRWYAGAGLDVINMTQYPEALPREGARAVLLGSGTRH